MPPSNTILSHINDSCSGYHLPMLKERDRLDVRHSDSFIFVVVFCFGGGGKDRGVGPDNLCQVGGGG